MTLYHRPDIISAGNPGGMPPPTLRYGTDAIQCTALDPLLTLLTKQIGPGILITVLGQAGQGTSRVAGTMGDKMNLRKVQGMD